MANKLKLSHNCLPISLLNNAAYYNNESTIDKSTLEQLNDKSEYGLSLFETAHCILTNEPILTGDIVAVLPYTVDILPYSCNDNNETKSDSEKANDEYERFKLESDFKHISNFEFKTPFIISEWVGTSRLPDEKWLGDSESTTTVMAIQNSFKMFATTIGQSPIFENNLVHNFNNKAIVSLIEILLKDLNDSVAVAVAVTVAETTVTTLSEHEIYEHINEFCELFNKPELIEFDELDLIMKIMNFLKSNQNGFYPDMIDFILMSNVMQNQYGFAFVKLNGLSRNEKDTWTTMNYDKSNIKFIKELDFKSTNSNNNLNIIDIANVVVDCAKLIAFDGNVVLNGLPPKNKINSLHKYNHSSISNFFGLAYFNVQPQAKPKPKPKPKQLCYIYKTDCLDLIHELALIGWKSMINENHFNFA